MKLLAELHFPNITVTGKVSVIRDALSLVGEYAKQVEDGSFPSWRFRSPTLQHFQAGGGFSSRQPTRCDDVANKKLYACSETLRCISSHRSSTEVFV